MEHASQVRNMCSQGMSTSTSSSFERTREACTLPQKNVEPQETCTHSTIRKLTLQQHLQQDAVMQSFIMHRFLPAAKEVAAEHESFRASLMRKNHSEAPSPSLQKQSRRTPKGFASSSPVHSQHQEDSMPHSIRSCGFFCLGLKNTLLCAHSPVSASGRSTLMKKSRAPHPYNHFKVAEKGTPLISSEMEGLVARKQAMGGVTKHQSGINVDVPILHPLRSTNSANYQEIPQRHALNYHDIFSRGDGCTNVGCNHSLIQSGKVNLAGNQFENMKSTQRPHDDHVSARKFASTALKGRDHETVQEGVAPCNQKRACDCVCHHVKTLPPHDLADENMSRSTLGGLATNSGKPAHDYNAFRSSWQDGDDDEDDEPQFCDASSRLSSVKSNATFHTFDSPRSESEALGFEGEWVNDELDFTDASSHFETPCASMSKNKSVLSHVCAENEKGTSGKISRFRQRVGKGLKLETERKKAISPSKHDPFAYEQKHEPQQAELETRRFSRLRHHSLDSMSGLYLSKASAICPVFPAKCQIPDALGWPFGIHQSSTVGGSPNHIQQEKSVEKHVVGGNVPTPPLPPAPTEPWLWKGVKKNASKPTPLTTLQQKEKVVSTRKTVDASVIPDASVNLDASVIPDVVGRCGEREPGASRAIEVLRGA